MLSPTLERLTTRDVADMLGYTVQHVRRLVREGLLDGVRLGRDWLISSDSVDGYLARRDAAPLASIKQYPDFPRPVHFVCEDTAMAQPLKEPRGSSVDEVETDDDVITFEGSIPGGCKWSLLQGDSRNALKLIPKESINCAVTSPPYYWQRDYGVEGQIGHEASIDEYVDTLVQCFGELRRTLRDDGVLFLNLGDTYYSAKGRPHGHDPKHKGRAVARRKLRAVDGPGLGLPRKSLIGIPWRVALAMQEDQWILRSAIVWKRPGSLPEPTAHDRPWRTHEHIFLFAKSPRYWFNRDAVRDEEDMWLIPSRPDNPGSHFAPYPADLVRKCLACGCPPAGTVLDPFVGSGTTMLVALEMGMSALGIELNPDYCSFIAKRIAEGARQMSLFRAGRKQRRKTR